jgi:glycerate kinase
VTGGKLHRLQVTGPIGEPVDSHFGILGSGEARTAVLEMAAAAGLRLVPKQKRDPLHTTTYGVGELIKAVLDAGAQRILLGCGDSGTNDGGAGAAEALGVKLLKADGSPIGRGGAALAEIDRIDLSGRDERLNHVTIDVACNIHNILCGASGVARVFGPQKGASPEAVEQLERALERYAQVIERDAGADVREMPGGGASGGMGAGLHALLGATLHSRYDIIFKYFKLDEALRQADLVLTAEGGINFQTPRGKVPAEVARRAKKYGLPVVAIAGSIGERAEINYEHGIDAMFSILAEPCALEEALGNSGTLLERSAENVMRALLAGAQLGSVRRARGGEGKDG